MLIIGYSRPAATAAPSGPALVQLAASADGTYDNSAGLAIPAGVAAGNTLVAAFKIGNFSRRTVTAAPSGWTLVGADEGDMGFYVYRKTAAASDAGTTASWTLSGSANAAFVLAEVSGNRTVEAAFSSASLDPRARTPSGGGAPTVWLAVAGARRGDNAVTAPPSGYLGLATAANAAGANSNNVRIAGAYRTAAAASEDPGAFTWTGTVNGPQAATLSVR